MDRYLSLATADLAGFGLERGIPSGFAAADEAFLAEYDQSTLWYDAIWRRDRVLLVCPKLMAFGPLLRAARITLDGRPTRIARHRAYERHDVLELKCPTPPSEIRAEGVGFDVATTVSPADLDRFAGLNTHVALSRDNDLAWIRDFATFHRRTQGLQAMVVFDNGSTRYAPDAVAGALEGVGLEAFAVVSVPLPFGRTFYDGRTKNHGKSQFLQTALLNVARLRLLSRARAVLHADFDELVWSDGDSVFDKAVASWLGYVAFHGEWRYPADRLAARAVHAEHDHVRVETRACPTKFCVVPSGPLRRFGWGVHMVRGLPLRPRPRRDVGYLHCARITTDWKDRPARRAHAKAPRRKTEPMETRFDPWTRELLDRGLAPACP